MKLGKIKIASASHTSHLMRLRFRCPVVDYLDAFRGFQLTIQLAIRGTHIYQAQG